MSELIYKNDGKPFQNERVAKMAAGNKKIDAEIVKVDGGYAIRKLGDKIIPSAQQEVTEPAKTAHATPVDVRVTESWRPKDATELPKRLKDPNFVYRFEHKHKRTIDKHLRLGWVIDRTIANKMREEGLLFADASCDSTFVVGDTILLKLPKDRGKARTKFYQERTMDGMKAKAKYDAKLGDCGVKSVGDGIEITRGVAG